MERHNAMHMEFMSLSCNEGFARSVAAAFAAQLDPTVEELSDIRTAVSEAVTNAIIHGYEDRLGTVFMDCAIDGNAFSVRVHDDGVGIANIDLARQPFYTTKPELERSGMGFTVMEAFMEDVAIESSAGHGTTITMRRSIGDKQD